MKLFLNLFQLILHKHYNFLYFGMIGFGTKSINLSSHFLSNKTQLLANLFLFVQSIQKVFTMIVQPYFFLIDIQFLQVKNKFLFKTVLINRNIAPNLARLLSNLPFTSSILSPSNVANWYSSSFYLFDFQNRLFGGFALLIPEIVEVIQCQRHAFIKASLLWRNIFLLELKTS